MIGIFFILYLAYYYFHFTICQRELKCQGAHLLQCLMETLHTVDTDGFSYVDGLLETFFLQTCCCRELDWKFPCQCMTTLKMERMSMRQKIKIKKVKALSLRHKVRILHFNYWQY